MRSTIRHSNLLRPGTRIPKHVYQKIMDMDNMAGDDAGHELVFSLGGEVHMSNEWNCARTLYNCMGISMINQM